MHRRRVLGDHIRYVGLDVHKDGIVVAVAESSLRGEVREYGRVANTPTALRMGSFRRAGTGSAKARRILRGARHRILRRPEPRIRALPRGRRHRSQPHQDQEPPNRWNLRDREKLVIARKGGASKPSDTLLPGKAGGAVTVRRTLATTICRMFAPTQVPRPRQLRDASMVMRFRPAHQSMINRRHDGRASCLARQSLNQLLPLKPQIHAPATWKGGHESG